MDVKHYARMEPIQEDPEITKRMYAIVESRSKVHAAIHELSLATTIIIRAGMLLESGALDQQSHAELSAYMVHTLDIINRHGESSD